MAKEDEEMLEVQTNGFLDQLEKPLFVDALNLAELIRRTRW